MKGKCSGDSLSLPDSHDFMSLAQVKHILENLLGSNLSILGVKLCRFQYLSITYAQNYVKKHACCLHSILLYQHLVWGSTFNQSKQCFHYQCVSTRELPFGGIAQHRMESNAAHEQVKNASIQKQSAFHASVIKVHTEYSSPPIRASRGVL